MNSKKAFIFLICLVSIGLFVYLKMPSVEVLSVIDFSDQVSIGGNVGVRPYREGGIRLEKELVGDKIVYHNYGHGGAGASLAPGSVKKITNLLLKEHPQYIKDIAVIGAGYMGLLTAEFLSKLGYFVSIYADSFPVRDFVFKNGSACITSQVAGGYWMPFGLDILNQKAHEEMQIESWNYYVSCIKNSTFSGIRYRDAYCFNEYDPFKQHPVPTAIVQEMRPHLINVKFGESSKIAKALKFRTISINGELFLNDILDTLRKRRNVTIVQKKFETLEDIKNLKEKVIFNCLGLTAGKLFDDPKMVPIKGQILYLKPQPGVDFFMFGQGNYGRFSIYPLDNKVAVGLTYEKGKGDLILEEKALENYRAILRAFYREQGVLLS